MNNNRSQIESFLNTVPEGHIPQQDEINMLKSFSVHGTYINPVTVKKFWQQVKDSYGQKVVNTFLTNGTGRLLLPENEVPETLFVTSYNINFCEKKAFELLHYDRVSGSADYSSICRDISHHFISGSSKSLTRYDIVIYEFSGDRCYYSCVEEYALPYSTPAEYYIMRAKEFVADGGTLVLLLPKSFFELEDIQGKLQNEGFVISDVHGESDNRYMLNLYLFEKK